MTKFLADENINSSTVKFLRKSKSPITQVDIVAKLISSKYRNKLRNNFVVATETKVRIRSPQSV